MPETTEYLTLKQLEERLKPFVPGDADVKEVIAGVALALRPPEERTLPIEKDLFKPDVVFAWHESDASATKMALEVLSELGLSFFAGAHSIANLGVALKELVGFLIELHKHRVRISDPVEVSVLLLLHEARAGLSSTDLQRRLASAHNKDGAPTLSEIERALDRLKNASATSGPKALVQLDGQIWKSLV